jgi:hypothetical protein
VGPASSTPNQLISWTSSVNDQYLRELGRCDPDKLDSEDGRLALACNAYNAFAINGVMNDKMRDSVDGFSVVVNNSG